MRDSMVFYRNFRDALSILPPEQRLEAYEAILDYGLDGIRPEGGIVGAMVQLVIPAIDKNNQRYENGKKGGRPKNQTKPNETEQNQTEPNETKTENTEPKGKVLSVKGKVLKDKESKRFAPPTVEEVKQYCSERNNNVDAEQFVDFYSSKNWMVGKNKMADWKSCVRTWERRDRPTGFNGMLQRPKESTNDVLASLGGRNGNLI